MQFEKSNGDERRIIKQFKLEKSQRSLVHPLFKQRTKMSSSIDVYLITIGHLWIYELIEENGFSEFLNELIKYSYNNKLSMLEWEIEDKIENDIRDILYSRNIIFKKYLHEDFDIMNYRDVLNKSKDKNHQYHQITRMLFLSKHEKLTSIVKIADLDGDINQLLDKVGSIINAAYLGIEYIFKMQGKVMIQIPVEIEELLLKNMSCKTESNDLTYYPKIDVFFDKISNKEKELGASWYLLSEIEQVIIAKLLYSYRLISELCLSLLGINGLLSAFVTRTMFDNYWQSKYLIDNNMIDDYRIFALDRMRLHVLKRCDIPGVVSINDLLSEVEGGIFDPIPINGDYFVKSAREYSIELGIKDEYDKYYEYNSEFVHGSLTAVYSGIMKQCSNPEHNRHLTIHGEASYYIDSAKHIFEIANMHIDLVNNFLQQDLFENLDFDGFFYVDRDDFRKAMTNYGIATDPAKN